MCDECCIATVCYVSTSPSGLCVVVFFFQAEGGIRYLVRSRGLGDVYKRQGLNWSTADKLCISGSLPAVPANATATDYANNWGIAIGVNSTCLLYTSDAADERSSVDLGGRRIIKKKNKEKKTGST